jgi:predicted site-specific integrase-resolvase
MKNLLTPVQVGERLDVNADTARRYMRSGMTCVIPPGGDLHMEEAELEAWTKRRRSKAAGQ